MIPKYTIEYSIPLRHQAAISRCCTDDPVACEEFVQELLERGYHIKSIKHEGIALEGAGFDKIIRAAAGMMASKRICASLQIKPEEEKFRFDFAA
jgi:hypothetical protein